MRKWICLIAFCVLTVGLVSWTNDVLVDKNINRYYMLEKELEQKHESYEVQVYGSCHAYTSFDPRYLMEEHGVSCYNMANPGEIIPTTYLRMAQHFKTDVPKVALVEIWGVNPYETYDTTERILGGYLESNIERLPLSLAKLEVISDFETLDMLEENLAIAKYKNRLLSFDLKEVDFNYSLELANETYNADGSYDPYYNEMRIRFENNGFKANPSSPVDDYEAQQAVIGEGESLEVEPVIMKYVDKIIDLCDRYGVNVIFYRSPYRSTANELRKVNYLKTFFQEKQILFFDLEEEITYDYAADFCDYEHLSQYGAYKSTVFLTEQFLEHIQ